MWVCTRSQILRGRNIDGRPGNSTYLAKAAPEAQAQALRSPTLRRS
ncbi:hypothetical protein SAMN06296378_2929 [Salinibacterium xinjiangense]|uniref:Uncharacterized protein n=1 Tax=Salinibacterium xinjiangense TaxID=386302 RepID=A0A2C9A3I8_9MICO|nr:hypothetical protein SAMN06296378_2929 [Salinibacterium xinjiangense]